MKLDNGLIERLSGASLDGKFIREEFLNDERHITVSTAVDTVRFNLDNGRESTSRSIWTAKERISRSYANQRDEQDKKRRLHY